MKLAISLKFEYLGVICVDNCKANDTVRTGLAMHNVPSETLLGRKEITETVYDNVVTPGMKPGMQ